MEVIDVTQQLNDVADMGTTMRVGDNRYMDVTNEGVSLNDFVSWTVSPAGILEIQTIERGYLVINAVGPGTCTLTATLPVGDAVSTEFVVLGAAFDEESEWVPPSETSLVYAVKDSAQVPLADVLSGFGLSGEVTEVLVSSDELLGVSDASGEWVMTVYSAFEESQWLQSRLDDLIYRIAVTNSFEVHKLTLDANGGDCAQTWYVLDGMAANPPVPYRTGYAFLGWYCGSSWFDPATPATEDCALTAQWETVSMLVADMVLPDDLTEIKEEAFAGIAAFAVYVPDGCTSIGAGAFRDCGNLRQIRIPADCAVADDAFDGCSRLVIFGTPGSEAEAYAASHEYCLFAVEQDE